MTDHERINVLTCFVVALFVVVALLWAAVIFLVLAR